MTNGQKPRRCEGEDEKHEVDLVRDQAAVCHCYDVSLDPSQGGVLGGHDLGVIESAQPHIRRHGREPRI